MNVIETPWYTETVYVPLLFERANEPESVPPVVPSVSEPRVVALAGD